MNRYMAAAVIALLACACGALPTAEEYEAAQEILVGAASGEFTDPRTLAMAQRIVQAYEGGGAALDWVSSAVGVAVAWLVPTLGGRGRRLVKAGLGAAMRGDVRGAAKAVASYAGVRRSGLPQEGGPPPEPPKVSSETGPPA